MADFCKQCSIDMFGEDFDDLKGLVKENQVCSTICEGCGFDCIVDHTGTCISATCLHKHGTYEMKG